MATATIAIKLPLMASAKAAGTEWFLCLDTNSNARALAAALKLRVFPELTEEGQETSGGIALRSSTLALGLSFLCGVCERAAASLLKPFPPRPSRLCG